MAARDGIIVWLWKTMTLVLDFVSQPMVVSFGPICILVPVAGSKPQIQIEGAQPYKYLATRNAAKELVSKFNILVSLFSDAM